MDTVDGVPTGTNDEGAQPPAGMPMRARPGAGIGAGG